MPSDIGSVSSYAAVGLRLWAAPLNGHGRYHDCCICADTRVYFGFPPLDRSRPAMLWPDEEWGPDSESQLLERGPA